MSSTQKRKEPWRNQERYYCKVCNIWCDSNRQSIMIHENGKKHIEAVEKSLDKKRSDKLKEEKDLKFMQSALQKMEEAARNSLPHTAMSSSYQSTGPTPSIPRSSVPTPAPPPPAATSESLKNEKKDWLSRKKQRQEEKNKNSGGDDDNPKQPKRRKIEVGEGTYEINGSVFLEGPTFSEILEDDMPIQIWTGSTLASLGEKRLIDREQYWKNGLATFVRRNSEICKVHVAYLASPGDEEETSEKHVALDRIRILLGSDEKIPDTLEEARLLAMGGEDIVVEQPIKTEVDETTGFTGWSTVTIKRTTVRQETKDVRAKLREERRNAHLEKEAQEKEAEARRMEEAKVANADDSALGAFDVWNKGGYKGIDIQKEAEVTVADTAKSLASGSVAFKKKKKKPMGKRNVRKTSADD